MIDRYVVDFSKTFADAMLTDVEPKMQQTDKDDPKSPWVQAKDKSGVLQWTVSLAVSIKTPDNPKTKHENISATMAAPEKPYEKLIGTRVTVEGLKLGVMAQARGGFSVFYSAEAIRTLQAARGAAAAS